ncbi:MAG: GNAT family N-acetyltransferase [Sphingosinicella sp.]|nr:GNAT family N-acetyltransferase [Sphingosinicella sp.]
MDKVLSLNQQNVTLLSDLDERRLGALVAGAFRASVVAGGEAFLISFDETADYDSPNFEWFKSRYPRFVYVDRVAVDPSARGKGLASLLYLDLFTRARAAGHRAVTCEVNIDPPNPGSDLFHSKLGFDEVGRATLASGKIVRYLHKLISD